MRLFEGFSNNVMKDADKMMRLWKADVKSKGNPYNLCDIRDKVKDRIKEVKNSNLYLDYCAYVKHLVPKPKVKMNQKKIRNEEMLDARINKWQKDMRDIMCSQMDLPKPVGPSKLI